MTTSTKSVPQTKEVTLYTAKDGTQFDEIDKCIVYEIETECADKKEYRDYITQGKDLTFYDTDTGEFCEGKVFKIENLKHLYFLCRYLISNNVINTKRCIYHELIEKFDNYVGTTQVVWTYYDEEDDKRFDIRDIDIVAKETRQHLAHIKEMGDQFFEDMKYIFY